MLARTRLQELMDNPNLEAHSHAEALRGLEQLNILSGSAGSIWTQLKSCTNFEPSKPIKVLDIATGGGDIPIKLWKYAHKARRNFEITGADISPTAISLAKVRAQEQNVPVSFIELDALSEDLPTGFDAIITSLFIHHLDPPQVISLLGKMRKAARRLVIVNDLIRSNVSLALVWLATRVCSQSKIVRYDGPASVRGAYTIAEMRNMAAQAGLNNCSVHLDIRCRQLLVWVRSQ
jgi:2-polyprenyl-3-methyl-5-hydroxy-6-metoxy-1,4-benzoquinol methylase